MIALLLSPIGRKIAGAGAVLAFAAFWVWWLRNDAIEADRAAREAQAARDRLMNINGVIEERRNVENLDDDGLLSGLSRWLLPDANP